MFTVHEYHAGPSGVVGRELLRSEFIDVAEHAAMGFAQRRYGLADTPFGSIYLVICEGDKIIGKIACRESRIPEWRLERS